MQRLRYNIKNLQCDLYMRQLPLNTSRRFYLNIAKLLVKVNAKILVDTCKEEPKDIKKSIMNIEKACEVLTYFLGPISFLEELIDAVDNCESQGWGDEGGLCAIIEKFLSSNYEALVHDVKYGLGISIERQSL